VPWTFLVGTVVVVVVVVVGVEEPGPAGPRRTGGVDTAGCVLVGAVTAGTVVVGVLALGVVAAVRGRVPVSVSVCVIGVCDPLGGDGGVGDEAVADDGAVGMPEENALLPVDGSSRAGALAMMDLGVLGGGAGLSATDTTIATMPKTAADPIPFCRRRTFISHQTLHEEVFDSSF
jgi:hypothetical protein